jgi:SAM-dependent methyltransferase
MTACRICGNSGGNRIHRAREMHFGWGDEFDYVECSDCGCLQIAEIPPDLARFYPADYYAFGADPGPPGGRGLRAGLIRRWLRHSIAGRDPLGWLLSLRWRRPPEYTSWFRRTSTGFAAPILEVGCGSGRLLRLLRWIGFRDLTGIDPYAPEEPDGEGLRIRRRRVEDHDGSYDLVLLQSSFEHVEDPLLVLREVRRLTATGRFAFVRTPIASSWAFRHYGVNWVQLDAPRHLHLLTPTSMEILAERAGFAVADVVFDSTEFQLWGSEQYERGVPLTDPGSHAMSPVLSAEEIAARRRRAAELNARGEGDSACFYLT